MCQVRSYLCQTAGSAMTQLLLRYNTTVTGASLFPSKSNQLLYHQFRKFMELQEVIAISQAHLSSGTLLIHSSRARGAGTMCRHVQGISNAQIHYFRDTLNMPAHHSFFLIWGSYLCLPLTFNFCSRTEMEIGWLRRVPRTIPQFHTEK